MRILVNDIAASKTGALSILKDFYHYIRENDTENEWIFLLSDHYLEETDRIHVRVVPDVKSGWSKRLLFDLFTGRKLVKSLQPDVFFSMQNTLISGIGGKKVLYVHQPLGYQKTKRFSFLKSAEREYAIYQHLIAKMIDASVKRADRVIVQTEWMRQAVIAKTHVKSDKVIRIPPTLPDLGAYKDQVQTDTHTFFYPSGNVLYKNHALLLEAAKLLGKQGMKDFRICVTLTKEELLQNLKDAKEEELTNFVCMGRIEREQVFEMYQKSVLLFPSYIETFGYPPAEASAIGTLVLASDCPFCKEVLNGYENAYYFDPFDPVRLSELMSSVMEGRIVRKSLPDAGAGQEHREEENVSSGWAAVVDVLTQA